MNRVVRHAIAHGLKPVTAIQMATLNTAAHFGFERELGSIAPGRRADLILTPDLASLPIELVVARGKVLAEDGRLVADLPTRAYPASARNTVRLKRRLEPRDFDIAAPRGAERVRARVIGVIENQAPTRALSCELRVKGGIVEGDASADVCQIALVERHRGTGAVVNAFVSGFGYDSRCAVASTVAHDSHQLIVVGTSKRDMALAVNRLSELGGGVAVYRDGSEAAAIALPIAGLMSDKRAEDVAGEAEAVMQAMRACGCRLNNAFMQHSLLALVVIPELRISDVGLIDVTRFERTSLFV
jgi:adenine deaminase